MRLASSDLPDEGYDCLFKYLVNDVDAEASFEKADIRPLVKQVGGKTELAPRIARLFEGMILDTYIEPCFGGGAVFFELVRNGQLDDTRTVYLSDLDEGLMNLHRDVRDRPTEISNKVEVYRAVYAGATEEQRSKLYYSIREAWNKGVRSAAKYVFLKYTCYRGLWRENKKGEMNTPYGKYKSPAFPSPQRFMAVNASLIGGAGVFDDRLTYTLCSDVNEFYFIPDIDRATAMYIDPPYDGTFSQYVAEGFTQAHQVTLIERCAEWSRQGRRVVYSNAPTEFIRETLHEKWPTAIIEEVETTHKIRGDLTDQGKALELLVHSQY